jgi:glycosyltransferase EpsE
MINEPKVSIIMGVRNSQKTLNECIESILNQTYTNWEFVICDDASTDNTWQILEFYKKKYPEKFILLKNDTNKKLAYSLNRCLEVSNGRYIARMDGDDISLPERLQEQVSFLNSNPEYSVVGTGMIPFDENGKRAPRIAKPVPSKYDLKLGPCFYHATIVARKEMFDTLKGYTVLPRTQRGQDADLWFRFFAKGYTGYNITKPLYEVRESPNDIKKTTFINRIHLVQTSIYGYKKLNFPWHYYLFAFKPLASIIIPIKAISFYRNFKFYLKNKVHSLNRK